MAEGRFIVFEGIDGSGTTTQAKAAAEWLRHRDIDVVETHEPTDGVIGKVIRKALRREMPGCEGDELSPELFALLFATDRMHHMASTVIPALKAGRWVVSDRCYLSSFAYQSVGADLDWVRALNRHVRRADLTLLLDLAPETALARVTRRTLFHQLEVFETPDKLAAIRPNYLRIAGLLAAEGEKIITIDASAPVPAVAEEVRKALAGMT